MFNKRIIKPFFKKSNFLQNLVSILIFLYLKFVYITSRVKFSWAANYGEKEFLEEDPVIFIFWHNRLAIAPRIFKGYKNIYALISPHSDGKIIAKIIKNFKFRTIEGSSNKNPIGATRALIQKLSSGNSVVLTPDGPRGPIYKINSNITQIAKKYNFKLIPLSCSTNRYFLLKSWDKLIVPLPFANIKVVFGNPVNLSSNQEENNINLEQSLMKLQDL